jgi:predicted dehydrogenase
VAGGGAGFANHAEYNFVPKNLLVKIPETVSFEDASCATVGSIALQGVRQCDLRLGENACVMGLGLLGLLAGQMLKASGIRIIGYDPNPERCQLARTLGFDLAVSGDLEPVVADFSQGRGVDAVLITAATKSNEPVTLAGELARMKGRVVVTGMVGMDLPRDMYYKKELDFKLSLSYGPGRYDSQYEEAGHDYPYGYVRWTEQRNMAAFLDLVAAGRVTPVRLVTHRFPLEEALQAYELLLGKVEEPYLGIVLNYSQPEPLGDKTRQVLSVTPTPSSPVPGQVGVGFIGVGNFAQGVLLPALAGNSAVAKIGVCDINGMAAAETARKNGFAYAATDIDKIVNDRDIHAVFIATRHNSHSPLAAKLLQAGKHVYTEKPLAISADDLRSLSSAYAAHPQILTVGFNRRFTRHARMLKSYFAPRTTPMVVNYRINAGHVPPESWLHDPAVGGGRIIGEVCHFIDFTGYLINFPILEVRAACIDTNNAKLRPEDSVAINLKYQDGSLGCIQYLSLGTPEFPKERCEVYADDSMGVMDDFRETVCRGRLGGQKLKGRQDKGFAAAISAFLEAIQKGRAAPIPFASLQETTAATFAVLQSLKTGQAVIISSLL